MNQGVENIRADIRLCIALGLSRMDPLPGPKHHCNDQNLNHTQHKPFSAIKEIFRPCHRAGMEQNRLDHLRIQPGMQIRVSVLNRLNQAHAPIIVNSGLRRSRSRVSSSSRSAALEPQVPKDPRGTKYLNGQWQYRHS